MTVYVLISGVFHEGQEIVGIYEFLEDARAKKKLLDARDLAYQKELKKEKPNFSKFSDHSYSDYNNIEPFIVL